MSDSGIKFDGEKPDYSLIPPFALEELAKLLTFGAKKYAPNNWQKVKPKSRYYAAMARHMNQYMQAVLNNNKKEEYDEDSGIHHLICVACNAMFLMEHSTRYSVDEPFYGSDNKETKPAIKPIKNSKDILDILPPHMYNPYYNFPDTKPCYPPWTVTCNSNNQTET